MKIEKLKQGQAVWVKGFVDRSVFGGCGGFIDFYNQDGNHCGHISRNNVREMKEEDVQIDQLKQQKPVVPKFVAEWIEKYKEKRCRLSHALKHVFDDVELGLYIKQQEGDYTEIIAKAWLYGYTVEKEKLYRVKLNDHLYFKEFIDSMFPVFVIDDMPGALDEAFIGKKELALKHAREFGGRLEEAEEVKNDL